MQSISREGGWAVLCGQEMVKRDIPMEILGEEVSFLSNIMKEKLWSQEENQEYKETRKCKESRFQEELVQTCQEGAQFIQNQKDSVLHQKEEVFWVSDMGFTDQKGFHQCPYHSQPTAFPSLQTPSSGIAPCNS